MSRMLRNPDRTVPTSSAATAGDRRTASMPFISAWNGWATSDSVASRSRSCEEGSGSGSQAGGGACSGSSGERSNSARGQVHAGQPVDHRVMHLHQGRDVTALETLDDVELPERLGPVERAREDPLDLLAELDPPAGRAGAPRGGGGTPGRTRRRRPRPAARARTAPSSPSGGAGARGAGARRTPPRRPRTAAVRPAVSRGRARRARPRACASPAAPGRGTTRRAR